MLGFLQSSTAETILLVYVALQVYSAFVQSLPSPTEYGGVWYKAFYNFLVILGADFKSFVSKYQSTSTSTSTTLQPSGIITANQVTNSTTKGE